MPKTCDIVGCDNKHHAKGICKYHYVKQLSQLRRSLGLRYKSKTLEAQAEYQRWYRLNHPEKEAIHREGSRIYMNKRRSEDHLFRKSQAAKCLEWRANLKREVFQAYGGFKCGCCGETEPLFLQLDHINGGGGKQRKELTGKNVGSNCYVIYAHLRKVGFPDGYQVLCANCNVGKHRNGGLCPHNVTCRKLAGF